MRTWMAAAVTCLIMHTLVEAGPLQVYILSGQSNMQGHAHVSTFDHIGMDPRTEPLLQRMRNEDGTFPILDRVHITYYSENRQGDKTVKSGPLTVGFGVADDRIGPEYTFGIFMQDFVEDPILIIKTAWGGKSLFGDFRPPSGATEDHPVGEYYEKMLAHVHEVLADPGKVSPHYDPAKGYEIAGFVWFQGWNDMTNSRVYPQRGQPGGYDVYTELLAHFIRDVRNDLQAPDMRFVIGVLGVGGPTELYEQPRFKNIHQNFRDAMAAPASMPEFEGNVVAVLTENYWDHRLAEVRDMDAEDRTDEEREIARGFSHQGFHYHGSGKMFGQFGRAFAKAMAGDTVNASRGEDGSGASSSGRRDAGRRISEVDYIELQHALQEVLAALSQQGKLAEIPLSLSSTEATVWLKSAAADGTLTFAMVGNDRKANLSWSAMEPVDQANLSQLAAQLAPENGIVAAIAAVYMELIGHPQQAQAMFERAGENRKHWESMLQ